MSPVTQRQKGPKGYGSFQSHYAICRTLVYLVLYHRSPRSVQCGRRTSSQHSNHFQSNTPRLRQIRGLTNARELWQYRLLLSDALPSGPRTLILNCVSAVEGRYDDEESLELFIF